MARGHSLDGVMKWLRRDEWRGAFAEVLDRHLARACAKADVEIEQLPSIIGEDWFMTLWGCAFEDFLSRDLDDGRNIVDDYLKRRGWKESASSKAYMAAIRCSVMTLYEVSAIVPGESFLARDLVRAGEPVRVTEHTATRSLKQWDRIAARVVQVGQKAVIGGGLLPFDRDASETVLGMIRRVDSHAREESAKLARKIGRDVDAAVLADAINDTEVLRAAAATFSTVWLVDLLQRQLEPALPEVRNSDGAYRHAFKRRLHTMGIRDRPIAPRSPWQNCYAERLIGSIRRECHDHVIALGEAHLRRILKKVHRLLR